MTRTAIHVDDLGRIERGPEAWRLATAAYDALLELLDDLEPDEWERPTVCEPWTVADVVRHVLGAAEGHASVREGIRQQIWAARHADEFGGSALDAWTSLHVRKHADLGPRDLLAGLREVAPRAVKGRSRLPALIGRIPVPLPEVGSLPPGTPDRITLGELNAFVYTRDTWLHRIDIARATRRQPRIDPVIDGRIVEDVVVEWARRHRAPFQLTLDGPAGGIYVQGDGGLRLRLNAIEFAWILSGRADPDPEAAGADLLRTRVLF